MKHQHTDKHKRQETQDISWETLMGKKTQQLLLYRFNSPKYNAKYKPRYKNNETLAKIGYLLPPCADLDPKRYHKNE